MEQSREDSEARGDDARALGAWIVAIVVLASLAALLREIDLSRVFAIVASADPRFVVTAVVMNLTLNTYARIRRRRELVRAAVQSADGLSLLEWTKLYFASVAGNNLFPARAGDVIFALELRRRTGFSVGALATAQLAEKLVETFSLWLLAPLCLILTTVGPMLLFGLYAFIAGGAAALTILAVFIRNATHPRLQTVARVATPAVIARAILWSSLQDLSDVAMVGLIALALSIHVGAGGWLLVYLAVNLASALPSAPGQIGLLEAGAVLALVGQGVGQSEALGFALLYHAAHFIPTTLAGIVPLMRLRLAR